MKRRIVAGVLIAAAVAAVMVFQPLLRHPFVVASLTMELRPRRLPVPVAGVAARDVRDSWGSPRPGGRGHEGVDIFAPRGRAVSAQRAESW
jgi:peptidoglycan LD-endopeptidase LytH